MEEEYDAYEEYVEPQPEPRPRLTHKSQYYRRKGYLYLPVVPYPRKYRPIKTEPVNPFKRAKERFGKKYQCPYCGTITTDYICPHCKRRIR